MQSITPEQAQALSSGVQVYPKAIAALPPIAACGMTLRLPTKADRIQAIRYGLLISCSEASAVNPGILFILSPPFVPLVSPIVVRRQFSDQEWKLLSNIHSYKIFLYYVSISICI